MNKKWILKSHWFTEYNGLKKRENVSHSWQSLLWKMRKKEDQRERMEQQIGSKPSPSWHDFELRSDAMDSSEEEDLNRPRRCSRLLTTTRLSEKMWQKVKEDKRNKAAKQKDRFVYSWKTSVLLSLSFTGFTPKTKEKRIKAVCVLVFHWCVLHFPHRRSSQCLAELVTPHSRPLPDEKVDVFSFRQRRCS